MVKHPVEVTLEGATKLVKVPFINVAIGAAGSLTVSYPREGEAVYLFFVLKEVAINSVWRLRSRQKLPTHRSRKRDLHMRVKWVWGDGQWGGVAVVESVGLAASAPIIHVRGKAMPVGGARGKDVGVTAPVRDAKNTGKCGWALKATVDGLRGAQRSDWHNAHVDKRLEGPRNVFD